MSNLSAKIRVHELAKSFDLQSKEITKLVAQYSTAPKSTQHVLSREELNFIFEHLTINNQVEDLEPFLVPVARAPEPEPPPVADSSSDKKPDAKSAAPAPKPQGAQARPKQPQPARAPAPSPVGRDGRPAVSTPNVRYVDTRGSAINLAKYDERIETLVPEIAKNLQHVSNVQRIKKSNERKPQPGQKRRLEEQEKMKRLQQSIQKKVQLKVHIPDEISVGELAARLKKTGAEVVKTLMKLGVMASLSQIIDFDAASLAAMEFGAKVEKEVILTIEQRLIDTSEDDPASLTARSPVVVVMGHVDHGKTSLLDAIRESDVVSGEAGGITQHIGAYRVAINDQDITFLDTPGHEAFTSMRARGANVTDIAVLVVAADDGIMPQTIEAINHAKAADVPIIVAINKMDKEGANPDRIMQQLTEYELLAEEWGGQTIICRVSAVTREGLSNLLEMILLAAEMRDLKANPGRNASGTVIEARLDKGRGPIATLLVQNGTLRLGDTIIAGTAVGHVRAMTDDKGNKIETAGPSVPVEITGLSEAPGAGDIWNVVEDERMARELSLERKQDMKDSVSQVRSKMSLDDLFSKIQEGNLKDLNIIVKADVQGSAEAVKSSLEKITNEEVRVRVIHCGVGAVTDNDVMLAGASNAIIVAFNVRPDANARVSAERDSVEIRMYRVIYDCIEEIEAAMKGMLAPKYKEAVIGHAEIRQIFKASGIGNIAGTHVQDGKIVRSALVRIVRDGVVAYEGQLASLKRFKDDAREVAAGFECGMSFEKFNDIKEGDIVEAYVMEQIMP